MRLPAPPSRTYAEFIKAEADALLRRRGEPPATDEGWKRWLEGVKQGLDRSFGRRPNEPCDLAPEVLGTLNREGYAVERLTFQSRPGVRVTANLYRPDPVAGPCPAVLSVHGHWPWARIDPTVQSRNIGLAKLGYVALAVDAFGAGERAIDPKPGAYHGGLVGASLWPAGVPLLGLQVYDNRRAVDYLLTRAEVDPKRLAVTGASGGGNQTLYAGATDDRFAAVVPVCGIGTYESYLATGCCVCEMNVAGLTYADTGDLLAMMAPRALLVISATQDALQFSVTEAAKSVAHARARYSVLDADAKLTHLPIESKHDYGRPMREAMYGWLDRWLRGKGDGSPVPEPAHETIDPALLRCYPDGPSRPKTIVTIPEFALREGRERLKALPKVPDHREAWEAEAMHLRAVLRELAGGPSQEFDRCGAATRRAEPDERSRSRIVLKRPDYPTARRPDLPTLRGRIFAAERAFVATTLLLRHEGEAKVDEPIVKALRATGRAVATVDLTATGRGKPDTPAIAGAADHNEAEWALWIGRPLLWPVGRGRLVVERLARSLTRPIEPGPNLPPVPHAAAGGDFELAARAELLHHSAIRVRRAGPFCLVALIAAALRPDQVTRVGLIDPLVSFVGPDATPWSNLPMGLIAPDILDMADVGHLAALVAPKPLLVAGGVEPTGASASAERRAGAFEYARAVYRVLGAGEDIGFLDSAEVGGFVRALAAVGG